jgi:hypothetical protein
MKFAGSTADAGGKFLGASFWKKGVRVEGAVTGTFDTQNGKSWSLKLTKAVKVGDSMETKVSIGNMKGFLMALRASGVPGGELLVGDDVIIECTGTTPTNKGNDQVNFNVLVDRD